LWETAAGQEWLRLLVFGTIYVFGIKCGIGAETLSEFSTYCNCALQVGCHKSALRSLEVVVRKAILEYQQQQEKP
jgi:hypothetical protein